MAAAGITRQTDRHAARVRAARSLAALLVGLGAVAPAAATAVEASGAEASAAGSAETSGAEAGGGRDLLRLTLSQPAGLAPLEAEPLERIVSLGVPRLDPRRPEPLPQPIGRRRFTRYLTPAAETLALQGVIMGWNKYVGAASWATVTPGSVEQNLTGRWVLDDNAYFVNQLGHPYQGTYPFTAARSAGLGFWTSAAFPFAASALWEVAGETEQPSINDQVTTTVAGIVLGEVLYRTSDWVRGDGRSWWRTGVATLLAPMNTINHSVLRAGPAAPGPQALRTETSVGVLAELEAPSGRAPSPAAPLVGVALTHGVPGDPDFRAERPFDHFDARFAFAPADDPAISLRARGLVAGTEFAAGWRGGGLFGVWLGFDLESPGPRRVSTSTLGLGATGRWAVGPDLALEGTAIGSAVVLGAAGEVARDPGSDRDYRVGPGVQSLLDVSLAAGDRLRAGLSLRQYLILGAGDSTGSDLLLDAALTARVRVAGHHGLQASASRFQRLAREADGSQVRQGGSLLMVSYVYAVDPPPPSGLRGLGDPDA